MIAPATAGLEWALSYTANGLELYFLSKIQDQRSGAGIKAISSSGS